MFVKNQIQYAILIFILTGCNNSLKNEWTTTPYRDAYGDITGVSLIIEGEHLSAGLDSATLSFSLIEDLISGGYRDIFTLTLNGTTSGDEVSILTPDGEEHFFNCYDGIIFNIDYETNDIARLFELMNFSELQLKQGTYTFSISTKNFLNLYKENFGSQNPII